MANIQDNVLKAIDTLVTNRISQIATDKTVTATVAGCVNSLNREYLVSYNGGKLKAFAQEGATYSQGQMVYVLIPEGDFTKQKNIVGLAQTGEDDSSLTFVSSTLSNYNIIGRNPMSAKNNKDLSLTSYKKEDYLIIYNREAEQEGQQNLVQIDAEELNNDIKSAEAIMLEASFRTSLPKLHKVSKTGNYGLSFVLAFNNKDETDENGNPTIKKMSYTLDSDSMTGSPFQYQQFFKQYQIFPIDIENFLYVDQIIFYCKDFVEKTDEIQSLPRPTGWGDDLFVKNIGFYGLKKIGATNGDYVLKLAMPQGSTLRDITSDSSLRVVGSLTKKNETLSTDSSFYWFKEDGRVTSASNNYRMYGGAGWAYLNKDSGYTFTTTGAENRAYENKYMCVCVYKDQVVLKDYFIIYNEAAKRDLSIVSSLGQKFSFDRGVPTLTCLIDGKDKNFEENGHADNQFRFVWSKQDEYGQVLTFNETLEELKTQMNAASDYSSKKVIKNKIAQLEGSSWDRNILTYPVKNIDSSNTFKCSVYLRDREPQEEETLADVEYAIGTATLSLKNEGTASPTDYYIRIENGDQVFQYSESGVAPDNERYTDPLEIKPLTCHFYDPAGLEVNKKTYTVKWRVPLESSLLVVPAHAMVMNEANNKIEYCTSEIFPTAIKKDYDYSALNNQIEAIVTYNGVEYSQFTNFFFTKIGENGTNGTDIVAKISPIDNSLINKNSSLALEIYSKRQENKYIWNTKQSIQDDVLQLDLFQRNEKLELNDTFVAWSMSYSGGTKYMSCEANGQKCKINWNEDSTSGKYLNYIIKASINYTVDGNACQYYAFYPVPVIYYYNDEDKIYPVNIDKTKTIKSITYNADGRNPLYNKNQGIYLSFGDLDVSNKYFVWSAEGGKPLTNNDEHPMSACFKMYLDGQNPTEASNQIRGNGITNVSIIPSDVYNGEYTNNLVRCRIYSSELAIDPEIELYIPIYFSLNTYGLQSLNAWDGNHVELNEDEGYVLAPQIGAGKKEKDNTFTGVLMGTAKTYDMQDNKKYDDSGVTGLLGYSHGRQSIWLDAETGSATFGLPENQGTENNLYSEGRIHLEPNGESYIGKWRIGSRALYNVTSAASESDKETSWDKIVWKDVKPGPAYKSYPVVGAQISVPPDAQGIILGANPSYISVKGKPLNSKTSSIQFNGANTAVKENDSLEVEIDPNKDSAFSIYRHTNWSRNKEDGTVTNYEIDTSNEEYKKENGHYPKRLDENGREIQKDWYRYPLVGINQFGQFYTNAVEDSGSATSMGIGKVGAFGTQASDGKYIGAQFGWSNGNLFKFFVDQYENADNDKKSLFISTGSTIDTEYPRSMSLYGSSLALNAKPSNNTSESLRSQKTDNRIFIGPDLTFLGHEDKSYIQLSPDGASTSKIITNNNLEITTDTRRKTIAATGEFSLAAIGDGVDGNEDNIATGNISLVSTNKFSVNASQGISFANSTHSYNVTAGEFSSIASVIPAEIEKTTEIRDGKEVTISTIKKAEDKYWRVGLDRQTLDTNGQEKIENTYLDFHLNGLTTLKTNKGLKIVNNVGTADDGIQIRSEGSGAGIKMYANFVGGGDSNGSAFYLTPGQKGMNNGAFLLGCQGVTIQSVKEKNNSGYTGRNYLSVNPAIVSGWGEFTGLRPGETISVLAKQDIKSQTGWVYAGDFSFNSPHSWNNYASHTTLLEHLSQIYANLRNLTNRCNALDTRCNALSSKLDAEIADRKTAVASKVSTSTFNAHKHSISYNIIGGGKIGYTEKIKNTSYDVYKAQNATIVSSIDKSTGTPN